MGKGIKAGLFGIGLDTYWGQFDGLLGKLTSFQERIINRLEISGVEVINAGMVDNVDKAVSAAELFNKNSVDIIFLNISTYALSHTVLPLIQRISCPVVVLNLQPEKAIDYKTFNSLGDRGKMTGDWLSYCQSCVTPELASVFNRAGINYHLITGYLEEEYVWKQITDWTDACLVKNEISNCRVGVMGHYYNGMLDVYSDVTKLAASFGSHFELIEFGVLKSLRDNVTPGDVQSKIRQFTEWFDVSGECSGEDLEDAAFTSVALDRLAEKFRLGALAYYYEGAGDKSYEKIVTTVIPGMTLLTGMNIPVAGECEIKNVLAMKIMDAFGTGGSFSEFYGLDFNDDIVLMGHDGPAHFRIADGKVGLVPLPVFHGKSGKGLSIQMKVKNGPVTILSVCESGDGKVTLLAAQGESVEGPTLQIGNTNSRYKFSVSARDFIDNWSKAGPSHHCAIGTGHRASAIEKLASLLGLEFRRIC
ncbi:MAG TPA: L-fucose/L-arabinose isomerase family protein [Bacteroidales bacterium]|nr:L-fucose/L-arabinose isomerase family protein [Bacteroidales bacterium]